MTKEIVYKCPECKWEGPESEMDADYIEGGEGEVWSNWICPGCSFWWDLKDYEIVEQ